jgi:hypothetical protein
LNAIPELAGKTLGCWCKKKPTDVCHGDVLVELVEKWQKGELVAEPTQTPKDEIPKESR